MRWTALTFAPLATRRLAAVCRRSCGLRFSSPAARAAGSNTRRRKLPERSTAPSGEVSTRSSRLLPSPSGQRRQQHAGDGHRALLVGLGGAVLDGVADLGGALGHGEPLAE